MLLALLQHEILELMPGKSPEPVRVNELGEQWLLRSQFDGTAEWFMG
jgi:hypothetical protein